MCSCPRMPVKAWLCSRCRSPEICRRVRVASAGERPARHILSPCRSAYDREHYLANKQRYVDQATPAEATLTLERTRYLLDYFACTHARTAGRRIRSCSSSTTSGQAVQHRQRAAVSQLAAACSPRSRSARCLRELPSPAYVSRGWAPLRFGVVTERCSKRATRIELVPRAWKAHVLPLHHARVSLDHRRAPLTRLIGAPPSAPRPRPRRATPAATARTSCRAPRRA